MLLYFVDLIEALFFILKGYITCMTKVNHILKFLRGDHLSFIVVSEHKGWTERVNQFLHNISGFLSFLNHEGWRRYIYLLVQWSLHCAEFWWFYCPIFFLKYLWIVLYREIQLLRTFLLLSRWMGLWHRAHRFTNAVHQVGRDFIFASSSYHWAVKYW
jgi:hypothetical protein